MSLPPDDHAAGSRARLAAEAARILGLDAARVTPELPLTALGLDSLAAVELAAAVEESTGVEVSIAGLLAGASLAELAVEVDAGRVRPRAVMLDGAAPAGEHREHALSAGQEALWFADRLAPGAGAYNLAAAVRIEGALDPAVLGRALQALADRHPALRTTFAWRAGEPRQVVHPCRPVDYEVDAEERTEAELPLAAWAHRPFDLEHGPLLRVRLWRLAAPRPGWAMLVAVHHLVSDLWSLAILARDLGALYAEAAGQGRAALPALPLTYGDHVRRQREALAGQAGERQWEFWRRRLGGELPMLALATDRPRPPVQSYAGVSRAVRLAPDLADRLRALGRAAGTTLYVTLLTAFQALLCRHAAQEEVVIGSPTAGRAWAQFLQVMGYFVNPVALRLTSRADTTWRELLTAAQATVLDAFAHQALPFPTIAARLRPARDPGRTPLFQAMFAFQQAPPTAAQGGLAQLGELALGEGGARLALADLGLVSLPIPERRALFDVNLLAAEAEAGLPVVLQLAGDLFDPATAERMLAHLASLLAALAAAPGAPAAAASLLSPLEERQLAAWNDTAVELPRGLCLPDLFAAQAARAPRREALIDGDERLTYGELARRAGRLAHQLGALGVGPEVRVAVCARRSTGLVAALLAVHRAGGAYVPLDPVQPAARRAWMLADAGAAVLVTEEPLLPELESAGIPAGCRVVLLGPAGGAAATSAHGTGLQPENLAYLIYTSGSTGRPKGVAIEHRSAVAFVQWARRAFSDAELTGVLAATSIGFDLSVFEIFVPLCWGGRVVLAESALALPRLPAAAEVRLVNTVPSVLAELLREDAAAALPGTVATVNLAGEPLPRALVRAVQAALPGARVLNLYGPTEDTTYSTWAEMRREDGAPAIGRPIANTRAHVLDVGLRQVPVGVPGELHLAGDGLARGYHGRPDLTAERFVPDPLARGGRLYRTGDLARRRPDGDLELLGRIDHQVKIRGVRVEPAEVEAALLSLPGLREAAVLPRGADHRLVAYVAAAAAAPAAAVTAAAIREALLGLLPRAMIPQAIVLLSGLPRTPNGKLDRGALLADAADAARATPEGVDGAADLGGAPPAYGTPAEELLAGIWSEALGIERVRPEDDFFDLGGHSLLALRVQARLRDRLGVELPLAAFFQFPTLRVQARQLASGPRHLRPLQRAPAARTTFPLSFAQARLWLLERLRPGTAVYHMAGAARLSGPLDVAALRRALAAVVRRHDALRARFREVGGEPVQEIAPAMSGGVTEPAACRLPLVCLAGLAPRHRDEEAARLVRQAARRPFDLVREAPLRPLLLRLGTLSHDLLLTLHHVAADEDSLAILVRELAALYGARPGTPPLPELPLRHADFALAQREWLRGEALEQRLAWWREELAGLPAVELPADRPRQAVRGPRGEVVASALPAALSGALAALGRREGVTLFMLLLGAFQTVLARTAGVPEVPVGSPAGGRDREALLPLIGFFVNTLVLRGGDASAGAAPPAGAAGAAGGADGSFRGLLRRVRDVTVRAHEHGDLPFELLVQALQPERGVGTNPFFEVVFALQRPPRGWQLGELACAPRIVPTGTAKFELTLYGIETEEGLSFALEHAAEIFDRATAARLLRHLVVLLSAAAADPACPVEALPLLSAAERQQLREWGLAEHLDPRALPPHVRPLAGMEARVLDGAMRPVAAGSPGELHLAGPGIEQGEAGGADWIAAHFLPDPAGRPPGGRLWRTGEQVRFRADGRLERWAGGGKAPRAAGENAPRAGGEMASRAAGENPSAAPPAAGAAAAAAGGAAAVGIAGAADAVSAATAMDRIVAEVWQELLDVETVQREDNFFSLGGHSLLLLPIQERLRQRSGVTVAIVDLFRHRTAGALARHLGELQAAALPAASVGGAASIAPRAVGAGDPPASFAQEQLWFLDRLEPGSPVYNLPTAVRLDGALDRAALRRALARLVARQAVLRTALGNAGGRTVQRVVDRLVPALPEVDLAALPAAAREPAARRLAAAEALLPFDLTVAPLFRAGLLHLGPRRHWLLVTFHHTITDGWSLRLFYEELGAFYAAEAQGGGGPVPAPLAVQYGDFAAWQRERLLGGGGELERLLAYWRRRLAGAPPLLDLPFDRPRPSVQRFRGISEHLEVDPETAQGLRALARELGATLFMTLAAVYATLLHRFSGQADLVLGTPSANRWPAELEPLLGFFANTLPLRLDLGGDPPFQDLVGRVRAVVLADFAHHEVPLEKIVEDLRPPRDLSHNAVYQVVLALETSPRPLRLDLPGLTLAPLPPAEGTAKFDLALYMGDHGGTLGGLLEANRDMVDRPTAVRWLRHLTALAAAAAHEPARRLAELPFLAPAEERQLALRLAAAADGVEVRGYRVDARRVEALLAAHPAVGAAAIVAGDDPAGGRRLLAYLTPAASAPPPAAADLRAFLAERLPEHMLPATFIRLAELPRTAAGALDLAALPAPGERTEPVGSEALPGADEAERIVAEIWRGLLNVEEIGPGDNFFALGGHSLLLLPMQEELERRFGVRLPVVELFKFPSAGALARRLSRAAPGAPPAAPGSAPADIRQRAERTQAAVGRARFAEARRRVDAAHRPDAENGGG